MPPPLARAFVLAHLAAFDEEALRIFLAPLAETADTARRVGAALRGREHDSLASRLERHIPAAAAGALREARDAGCEATTLERRRLVTRLFWPLLYWHAPELYEELVEGEDLHPGLLDLLCLEGTDAADLGAGAGRFTLLAARRARSVVAVDAVPTLLDRLRRHVAAAGLHNVEIRRGDFLDLPLADASVDVAVACSSMTSRPPFGGEAAVAEARRVVRPGGLLAVIWPDQPSWFTKRGFEHVALPGPMVHRFRDPASAERLCRLFYGEPAASWVRANATAAVPYSVLGTRPPADACLLRRAGGSAGPDELRPAPLEPGIAG